MEKWIGDVKALEGLAHHRFTETGRVGPFGRIQGALTWAENRKRVKK